MQIIQNNFKYDNEGLWSMTLPKDAEKISKIILKEFGNNLIILDNTGGLGGNIISFSKFFTFIIGIEINADRFQLLKANLKSLNNILLINDNCINILIKSNLYNNNIINHVNCYFFDPPWGGPNYKTLKNIRLTLGTYSLKKIIILIRDHINNKPIIMKLPFNYDLSEFSIFNYKIYYIKNYLLLIIYL